MKGKKTLCALIAAAALALNGCKSQETQIPLPIISSSYTIPADSATESITFALTEHGTDRDVLRIEEQIVVPAIKEGKPYTHLLMEGPLTQYGKDISNITEKYVFDRVKKDKQIHNFEKENDYFNYYKLREFLYKKVKEKLSKIPSEKLEEGNKAPFFSEWEVSKILMCWAYGMLPQYFEALPKKYLELCIRDITSPVEGFESEVAKEKMPDYWQQSQRQNLKNVVHGRNAFMKHELISILDQKGEEKRRYLCVIGAFHYDVAEYFKKTNERVKVVYLRPIRTYEAKVIEDNQYQLTANEREQLIRDLETEAAFNKFRASLEDCMHELQNKGIICKSIYDLRREHLLTFRNR